MAIATMPTSTVTPSALPEQDRMRELIADIETLVFESTGKHVFRNGRDGSFTPRAAALVQMIAQA